MVAVARARAGDCRPSNRSTISSSWLFLAPRTMPASEGRYLAALPAEHKDAAPESLYQVRPPPAAQLTAAETRNRREGRVRRSVQRKTHRYRPYRRTQNHQPRHRRRRCRRYTKGNFPPPAAHARRLKLGRPAPQRDQVLWQSHAGPARLDHHGVRGRWKYTNSGTCLFYGRLLSPNTKQKSRAQPLKELHICLVIREVLLALAFLHKNGVIHRDIKGTFAFFFLLLLPCTLPTSLCSRQHPPHHPASSHSTLRLWRRRTPSILHLQTVHFCRHTLLDGPRGRDRRPHVRCQGRYLVAWNHLA